MAGLAALRETALVRIGVAVGAFAEGDSRIPWLVVGARRVAFLAAYLYVQSR